MDTGDSPHSSQEGSGGGEGDDEAADVVPEKLATKDFSSQELNRLEVGGIACGITREATLVCEDFTYDFGEPVLDLAVSDFLGMIQTICALLESGKVRCVNGSGYALDADERYVFISASDLDLCGVTAQGKIDCVAGAEPEGEFVSVAAGSDYSCAIKVSGEVFCFDSVGENVGEQVEGTPPGKFVAVAVNKHLVGPACGILSITGELVCWTPPAARENSVGYLYPPQGSFVEVAVGFSSACAIDDSKKIVCFTRAPSEAESSLISPVSGTFSELRADGGTERYCALDEGKRSVCWEI